MLRASSGGSSLKAQRVKLELLSDDRSLAKFCAKNDKEFGCKAAFMCGVSCPLWIANEVQMLVNEKGMTIGEAHRACLRAYVDPTIEHDIIREAVVAAGVGKQDYPATKVDSERRTGGQGTSA